jgi:hypothetical protein
MFNIWGEGEQSHFSVFNETERERLEADETKVETFQFVLNLPLHFIIGII